MFQYQEEVFQGTSSLKFHVVLWIFIKIMYALKSWIRTGWWWWVHARFIFLAKSISFIWHLYDMKFSREDFEHFILKLCFFFTAKYTYCLFLFLQVQSIYPKPREFNSKLKSISTSKFQPCIVYRKEFNGFPTKMCIKLVPIISTKKELISH